MLPCKLLSIDESGKASFNHPSPFFVISGTVISEKLKTKIDAKMRRLKKKFFDNEEIVFHARDMARKKGPFVILCDTKKETRFWSDFVSIVNNPEIVFFFVVTDKKNAKKQNWQPQTILRRSYLKLLTNFVKYLKVANCRGKIITESEPSQDAYLIYAHNRLQSEGTDNDLISAIEYKKRITALSLVSKANQDIDVQLADIMALIVVAKYKREETKDKHKQTKIETVKDRLLQRKLSDKKNRSLLENLI